MTGGMRLRAAAWGSSVEPWPARLRTRDSIMGQLAALHPRNNTLPAEVPLLELAAEVIEESGTSPAEPISTSRSCTVVDPTLKDLHSLRWPRAVARHRAILHAFQDIGSVSANIVEGPEIKCSFHGLLVKLPEERLDICRIADAVVVRRRIHPA